MTPTSLTLNNFIGIQSGMKRDSFTLDLFKQVKGQIVAIHGDNGVGKSTVLDNLHPYRLMPSRAKSYSPKAFSYYNHVYGEKASKELNWSFKGIAYRSILEFKLGKTNSTTAYLQERVDDSWEPYSQGSLSSDGKTVTYDKCIKSILGSPELFFTSAFSAQNRTSLSDYDQSTVKSLMAELLDMTDIEDMHEKCAAVIRSLKIHIKSMQDDESRIRQELTDMRAIRESHQISIDELKKNEDYITYTESELALAQQSIIEARELEIKNKAQLEKITDLEKRAMEILSEGEVNEKKYVTTISEIDGHLTLKSLTISNYQETNNKTVKDLIAKINNIEIIPVTKLSSLDEINRELQELDHLVSASFNLDQLKESQIKLEKSGDERNKHLKELRTTLSNASGNLASLTNLIKNYELTASLINEVPCCNTPLSKECKLLSQANSAAEQVPSLQKDAETAKDLIKTTELIIKDAEIDHQNDRDSYKRNTESINSIHRRQELITAIEQHKMQDIHLEQIDEIKHQITMTELETKKKIDFVNNEITFLQKSKKDTEQELETIKEKYSTQYANSQKSIFDIRSGMKFPKTNEIQSMVSIHQGSLAQLKSNNTEHRDRISKLSAQLEELDKKEASANNLNSRHLKISDELSAWLQLSTALSKNGIIALSIDDAGPSISAIANEILTSCYGHRFTVSIETQGQTAKGDVKEIFDIIVFDSQHDKKKSVRDMSGGEQIWINEAITRAISLFQAERSSICYETLFADESDGALDQEHKSMFMDMKRKVLEIGGYSRELFISHTPDLWERADSTINLNQFKAN